MRLATRGPFHLQATVRVLQRRPINPLDVWDGGRYLRVLRMERGCVLVGVHNAGTIVKPDLHFVVLAHESDVDVKENLPEISRRIVLILGLDVDPAPLQRALRSEPILWPVIDALCGLRPPCFAGFFEAFLGVIPFQQLSLDAGLAIVRRLVERFGHELEYAGARFFAAPASETIAAAPVADLCACGLSARKAESLQSIARDIASGVLQTRSFAEAPTEEALRSLLELHGIGPWSAALVLLRGFRRLDVFPPGDVGARRTLGRLLAIGVADVEGEASRFGVLRGYLYFLGLGANLLEKGLIVPAQ